MFDCRQVSSSQNVDLAYDLGEHRFPVVAAKIPRFIPEEELSGGICPTCRDASNDLG